MCVAALIKKLWDISWDQWECRNGALNNTSVTADLIDTVSLDKAISAECEIGSIGIPSKLRREFPTDTSKFLTSTLIERKCWIILVRAAREIIQDNRI